MTKDEIREFTLKFIKRVRLNCFDFEDLRTALIIYTNRNKDVTEYEDDIEADEVENANDVLWDLVIERKLNPAPYGSGKEKSTKFFVKK